VARYTNPSWKQAPGGHWWYYGDNLRRDNWPSFREFCYAVTDYAGRVGVREPHGAIGEGPQHIFPDLQTAKTWVEIEASNHV
jgi:hypothetical protein